MAETVENVRREILKRVGIALIVFGLFDVGVMIYCVINRINYSSSFNILAVLGGTFVWRGYPWAVRWARRASGFFLGAFIVAIIASPLLFPIDLGVREMRAHPLEAVGLTIYSLGALAVLAWTHWQLRSPAVVPTGPSAWMRWCPSVLGAALATCIFTLVSVTLHGESSRAAIELARNKVGPSYHFWISNLQVSGEHGRAHLLAYNESTIQTVDVDW
jgi:hypothetical protein